MGFVFSVKTGTRTTQKSTNQNLRNHKWEVNDTSHHTRDNKHTFKIIICSFLLKSGKVQITIIVSKMCPEGLTKSFCWSKKHVMTDTRFQPFWGNVSWNQLYKSEKKVYIKILMLIFFILMNSMFKNINVQLKNNVK